MSYGELSTRTGKVIIEPKFDGIKDMELVK